MSSDRTLRREIEILVEGAAPPAPWLEQRVIAAVRARQVAEHWKGRLPQRDFGALGGFGSGARLAAGLVALLIAVGSVAALLMGAHLLHNPTVPGGRSATLQTPSPIQTVPFTPSPPVRALNWPPGGPVPTQLAGSWQAPLSGQMCRATSSNCVLHLGAYTFQVGNEHPDEATNNGTIGPPLFGNVVVNGSEIDFMSDLCTPNGGFGFERFTYTLNSNILVITRTQGPGQTNCATSFGATWPLLAGTYSRVSTP